MKMLIRKVFGLLVLGGFLAFCWLSVGHGLKCGKVVRNA
jgi:hypothetical protein